jgi:cytochrome c2
MTQHLGNGKYRLYLSHHFWNKDDECYSIRVSTLDTTEDLLLKGEEGSWDVLYETSPCQELLFEDASGQRFGGMRSGGRVVTFDENNILLSTGDHNMDGYDTNVRSSQETDSLFGKTIKINMHTGESEIFTVGLRNPQGLFISKSGTIWETEYGPRGGDEINILKESLNYGWPEVTYGRDYDLPYWPLNKQQGRHDGYELPLYVFVPSIGISNLIQIEEDLFPNWKGDLLVGSLIANKLFRIRVNGGRVTLVEPIELDRRIRDIIELENGSIVLWTDEGSVLVLRKSNATFGTPASFSDCMRCHLTYEDGSNAIGPNLWGIYGKPIASNPQFKYTQFFGDKGGVWDHETLDKLLESPNEFAPGTTMVTPGIEDASTRDEIIAFLETLKKNSPLLLTQSGNHPTWLPDIDWDK